MSTISAVNPLVANATTSGSSGTASALPGQKTLGQDDFLKLLAQQFKSQDPMKPMDDTSFIAQMAQFTSLQQTSEMAKTMTALSAQQQIATANSYIGHKVTVDAGQGQTDAGDVTAVKMVDGSPQLVVNGQTYAMSAVLLVEPSALTSPAPSNPTP